MELHLMHTNIMEGVSKWLPSARSDVYVRRGGEDSKCVLRPVPHCLWGQPSRKGVQAQFCNSCCACKYMQNWKLLPRSFADLYSLRVWSSYPVICPFRLLGSMFWAWWHCCLVLWSSVNISISSVRNAVATLLSNSFSRGRVQDFSLTCSLVLVFGEGFGALMFSFWGLLQVSWIIPFIHISEWLCWGLQPEVASKRP